MPNRIVRDSILSSEQVCSLGWAEEVFYRRLMSIVDDYGRTEANPQLLRSRCYPLQTDDVRTADISRWMAACQKAGLILGYEVAGKRYLEIRKFGQQQRAASKCPDPPSDSDVCNQVISDEHLGVVVSGGVSVVEGGGGSARARPPRATRRCPADFVVTEDMRAWARDEASWVDVDAETAKLRDYEFGKAKTDWQATWRNWIRKAAERRPQQQGPPRGLTPSQQLQQTTIAGLTGRRTQPGTIDVDAYEIPASGYLR